MHPVAGVGPVPVVPPSGLWRAWTFDPLVVAGLGAAAVLYARGWARLKRGPRRLVRPRQAVAFFAGLGLLAAALVSPVDALADTPPPALHAVGHLTFLVSALAFWSLVIDAAPRRRLGYGPAILLVFVTMLAGAALGALITFSSTVLYPIYGAGARLWGTTPLADPQAAGAIMWIPPVAVTFLTVIFLALRWFEDEDATLRP